MNLYENIKNNLKESVKVGPIYRIGPEEYITSYNDIRLDGVNTTLEDIELFKRVDWSNTAPDKVNYLLAANMRWDVDPSVSVPVVYNIGEDEYEDEINPALLGVFDEDLDLKIYNAVDEAIKNLALEISMSGRMNESEESDKSYGQYPSSHIYEFYPSEEEARKVADFLKKEGKYVVEKIFPLGDEFGIWVHYKSEEGFEEDFKMPKEAYMKIKEESENEEDKEPIGWEVKYLQEVYPGEFTSVRVGVYNTPEQAEEKVSELQSQGFNASYDVLWEEEEDPDYDKYADDTNWAAEEEAEAIERMERRYGQGQE